MGMRGARSRRPEHPLSDGEVLRRGPTAFTVRHTPGHSPGSVSFVGSERVFGVTCSLPDRSGEPTCRAATSSPSCASIHRHLLTLPDDTILHSGHGPDTTIGVERSTNPFITGQTVA